MDKLSAMQAFAKVVEAGTFAAAARDLGVTRSAVSKAVMELERILGARLLDRTTRKISPTEAGLAYFERCREILAEIEVAEMQISRLHDEPRGTLKVNAPMSFGAMYLGEAISEFMTAYPDVKIELHLNDRFIDPIEEGMDITIRIAELEDSSLIARRLAPARRVLAAAPAYLKRARRPASAEDLRTHHCLNYGHTTTLQQWVLIVDGRERRVAINSRMCANNGEVLVTAAVAGHGIVNLPTFLVGPAIKAGELEVVLPDAQPSDLGIFALYAPNRYLAAKTRVFIDFLVDRFGDSPNWDAFASGSGS